MVRIFLHPFPRTLFFILTRKVKLNSSGLVLSCKCIIRENGCATL